MQRYASLRQGLVGCWCPSVSGPFGYRLPDLSGYGNHGTLTNMDPGTDWVTSGGKGALDFDGSNDHVYTSLGVPSFGTNPLTVSGWGRNVSGTSSDRHVIFSNYNGSIGGGGQYVVLRFGDFSVYRAQLLIGTDNNVQAVTGTTNMNDGLWHNLVGVRNASGVFIYVDGILQNSTLGTPKTASNTIPVTIGALSGTWIQHFPGQLDDIRIYNRALSESEIRLLASGRGVGLIPERQRNRYQVPPQQPRNRSSRFLSFPA